MLSTILFTQANRQITMTISHDVIMKTFNITTSLVGKLYNDFTEHVDVLATLNDLDVEATTKTGEALVKELSDQVLKRESIKVCLRYLHRSITALNTHLDELHTELQQHTRRYFRFLRRPQTESVMMRVRSEFDTMKKRLEMLIKLLQTTP